MQHAALTKTALLRREKGPPKSLLAGDFFYQRIRNIFCEIASDTKRSRTPNDDRSDTEPGSVPDQDRSRVTLFVTATALGGQPITVSSLGFSCGWVVAAC